MEIFVPGRICLFGEHSDWAGGYRRDNKEIEKGYTIICGTNQGIYSMVEPHPTSLVLTSTTTEGKIIGPYEVPMELHALLKEARGGGFWSYIAGTAYWILRDHPVRGLVINNHSTDLPIKKGVSSSAAICVLTARAFNKLYDLGLRVRDEMEIAYQGEITTPSRCGRMDQVCAFGHKPMKMTFDGDNLGVEELQVGGEHCMVIVDLQAGKNTQEILRRLNSCYPVAKTERERRVHELLGPINKRIIQEAVAALRKNDQERLGELMIEAQAKFDEYVAPVCPEELNAPILHRVLNFPPLKPHIWGGKGVGSQGDGAAQFITRSAEDQEAVIRIMKSELGMNSLRLTIANSHPGELVQ